MSRFATIFATCTLVIAMVACGGKDKGGETGSTGTISEGTPSNPEDMGPDESGDVPVTQVGEADGDEPGGGDEGAGDGGAAEEEEAAKPPPIQPPGLDLSAAEKSSRVKKHVRNARAALKGKSKDPNRAIKEAEAALAVDETSVEAMVLLAHGNYVKKYYDLAEDILEKALERGGASNKQLHFLRGLVFERTEQEGKALGSYKRAISLDPNYRSALQNAGVHYLASKRYGEAVRTYEHLTGSLKYKTPAAWTNLGSAYRGQSSDFAASDVNRRNELLQRAETTYKRAISVNKNYGPAYYNLGLLYLDADPFPTAKGDMDRLKRLSRAKTYFDEYRRLPGAKIKLVDAQSGVAQKLYDREVKIRKKKAERERRRKEREERRKKQPADDDEGFE